MNPATGTFLSVDPVVADYADPQSYNAYAYARNNPVSYTDPTGMFFELWGPRAFLSWLDSFPEDASFTPTVGQITTPPGAIGAGGGGPSLPWEPSPSQSANDGYLLPDRAQEPGHVFEEPIDAYLDGARALIDEQATRHSEFAFDVERTGGFFDWLFGRKGFRRTQLRRGGADHAPLREGSRIVATGHSHRFSVAEEALETDIRRADQFGRDIVAVQVKTGEVVLIRPGGEVTTLVPGGP